MLIKSAEFVVSNTDVDKCPENNLPEYAFIGRSNVGKSSLINMLTNNGKLAKTSGKPGKTRLINHFLINEEWYLVDLPGYGFAKVSKTDRKKWEQFVRKYLLFRKNLYCVCLLIDARIEPQKADLEFMHWLGKNQVPFVLVFTKVDKLKAKEIEPCIESYKATLLQSWEETPEIYITSAETGEGREELLDFIDAVNRSENE